MRGETLAGAYLTSGSSFLNTALSIAQIPLTFSIKFLDFPCNLFLGPSRRPYTYSQVWSIIRTGRAGMSGGPVEGPDNDHDDEKPGRGRDPGREARGPEGTEAPRPEHPDR